MREGNPELHRQRVSTSLIGKYGNQSRRWKGDKASYAAVHIWIKKHWGKPDHCDMCRCENASRYEGSNVDWKYRGCGRIGGNFAHLAIGSTTTFF